jgi:hypothetical protein
MTAGLVAWLVAYMLAVSPSSAAVRFRHEVDEAHVRARYEAIATDVAAVALDPSERIANRPAAALWLAAQAFCESAFDWRVDSGHCTAGTCDNGKAWSIWQLHDGGGLVLDGGRFTYASNRSAAWLLEHAGDVVHGPDLISDRRLAARFALHMRRVSAQLWTTHKCTRDSADAWSRRMPFLKETP